MKKLLKIATASLLLTSLLPAQDAQLDEFLRSGRLSEGLAAFSKPANDGERFSLGVLQSLQGLQQFADGAATLGLKQSSIASSLPFFRVLPAPTPGASSGEATPAKVRAVFENLREALKRANATLGKVGEGDFKVQVTLSGVHLKNTEGVPAMPLADSLGRMLGLRVSDGQELVVNFDSADAIWLKGYTHVLVGMLDVFLAYDWEPVWNQCASTLFTSPNPQPALAKYIVANKGSTFSEWPDLIAALHEMRLDVKSPDGLRKAAAELRAAIACSRTCWARVQAESDDDREWLPSPGQTGPRGARITQQEIDGWLVVLNEVDAILTGKKLLPHWRLINGMGVNVARLVQSPPKFDLVLIVQGSALVPYIEGGEVSDRARWRTLMAPFGPGFMRFALWSN